MTLDTAAFEQQAAWCRQLGSNFTAQVLDALTNTLDETTRTGRTVVNWAGAAGPLKDVVPLRLTGALHALVLAGKAPDLAQLYPPNAPSSTAKLSACIDATMRKHDAEILSFLSHAPQTNEVARSSLLIAGLAAVTSETGTPINLYEIGASGGLNLNLEKYAHQQDGQILGDAQSSVQLKPEWTGKPPAAMPRIATRSGCDLNPIDVTKTDQATRLLSYIWPDQPDRLKRTKAAISITQSHPPKLDTTDAADWVETICAQEPNPNHTRVLMHSIAWQYMPEKVQNRITKSMMATGAKATASTPLAWLAFELNDAGKAQLTLQLWPGDGIKRVLADANPHVHNVYWKGLG